MARNRLNYWCVEQKRPRADAQAGHPAWSAGLHDAEERFLNPAGALSVQPSALSGRRRPSRTIPTRSATSTRATPTGTASSRTSRPIPNGSPSRAASGCRASRAGSARTSARRTRDATDEFVKNYVAGADRRPVPRRRDRPLLDARRRQVVPVRGVQGPGHPHRPQSAAGPSLRPGDRARPGPKGKIHRPIDDHVPGLRRRARAAHAAAAGRFRLRDLHGHVLSRSAAATCTTSTIRRARANDRYRRQLQGWAHGARAALPRPDLPSASTTTSRATSACRSVSCTPWPTTSRTTTRLGARHFHYMHVTTGNWGNKALTNYQMARQLWDVEHRLRGAVEGLLHPALRPGGRARCGGSTSRWSRCSPTSAS